MNIKDLLKENSMTSRELSRKLGVHYNTISDWNRKKRHIPDKYLPKLAEIFGIELQEILKLKYDFSQDNNPNYVSESPGVYAPKNQFSELSKSDITGLLHTEREMLIKVETGITKLLGNGNDIESLQLLDQYTDLKKKILKTIAELEANL